MHPGGNEWARYYRRRELDDLQILHARFVDHAFARHSHDYFVVGYVEAGAQAYRYRGARHVTTAGELFLVNPDEAHTGEAADGSGYIYRTVYPRPALMLSVARELCDRAPMPAFRAAVIKDHELRGHVVRFHQAIERQESSLAVESHLIAALGCLIARYAERRTAPQRVRAQRMISRRARDYIDANLAMDISLAQLAAVVHRSPYHFARAFQRDIGIPPHVYLDVQRIRKARELLDAGVAIAQVATSVGYADQSHLTHRFKRLLGISPAQYRRGH
jgi:AraC-like DNA-binding protein